MKHQQLVLEAATDKGLRPFGDLLARSDRYSTPSDFYRGYITMSHPVNFRCEHPVEIALATLTRRLGEVRYLERHFAHTQTFIPLGGKPFVMVMAPPSARDMPDLALARAFHFDGRQGFMLHVGTWHEFPFAVMGDTDIVVILSSQTGYDLEAKDPLTQEAQGPDLDKKDIAKRSGVILTLDLDASPCQVHEEIQHD